MPATNAPCGADVCSEHTAGSRRRKLSNAVWRSNEKTPSHSTILLFFKTGEESGLLKPAPAAHQLWFWKTELLSKIFVLANIISELPSAPGAIRSSWHTLPVHTGSLYSQRATSQLQGRGDPWGPAVYFLSGSLQPCWFCSPGAMQGQPGVSLAAGGAGGSAPPALLRVFLLTSRITNVAPLPESPQRGVCCLCSPCST